MLEFDMNERIYDIEKQAWEFVDKTWNWANANNPSQATLFKTKFAELIVKETMQVVANQLPSNQYLDVAHAVIEHYKDH
jgi:hypothetical protein